MTPQLHDTLIGRKLIEGTIPEIVRQLERIADLLENKEKEMAEITKLENLQDKFSLKDLIEFLEYEEALTKDGMTAKRIRKVLTKLGVWPPAENK
jgi:aspartate ammonia-lyase